MALETKHQFGSIGDTRVTFVEKGVNKNRMQFLVVLLEHNGFTVLTEVEPVKDEDNTNVKYTVAVTDILFNPIIWIYERRLYALDGKIVTPDYWIHETENTEPQYWERMYD